MLLLLLLCIYLQLLHDFILEFRLLLDDGLLHLLLLSDQLRDNLLQSVLNTVNYFTGAISLSCLWLLGQVLYLSSKFIMELCLFVFVILDVIIELFLVLLNFGLSLLALCDSSFESRVTLSKCLDLLHNAFLSLNKRTHCLL